MHVCVFVSVFVFPDLPEISVSHVSVLVTEGDNVTVSCNGSASPLPEVDWTVSGLHSINTHLVRHTHERTMCKQLSGLCLISFAAFIVLIEMTISGHPSAFFESSTITVC